MLDPAKFEELLNRGIKGGEFPPRLFKYRAFGKYTEDIFKNNTLYFSAAEAFNDPFDCQIKDQGGYSPDQIMQYLVTRGGMDKPTAAGVVAVNSKDPNFFSTQLEKVKANVLGSKGILSLAAVPNNILMWSHYAQSHSGFALGFDLLKDPQFFNAIQRVYYSQDYPVFNYITDPHKMVTVGLGTKSELWEYEEEFRIIKNDQGPHQFAKVCLVEVILGCRIDPANEMLIRGYLNNYGYGHVTVKKAQVSTSKYELKIV